MGGPLAPANLVALMRMTDTGDNELEPIVDDIYVSADPEFLSQLLGTGGTEQTLRVYAGHAGWDAGQLDQEIAAGSWQVLPASAEFVFTNGPLELWAELRAPQSELMVYRADDRPRLALPYTPDAAVVPLPGFGSKLIVTSRLVEFERDRAVLSRILEEIRETSVAVVALVKSRVNPLHRLFNDRAPERIVLRL